PDGHYVTFARGSDAQARIYRMSLLRGSTELIDRSNSAAYYPVVSDLGTYYYVRASGKTSQIDQIYCKPPDIRKFPRQLPLNDCLSDNSDPTYVTEHLLIFSSRYQSSTYNL